MRRLGVVESLPVQVADATGSQEAGDLPTGQIEVARE
jgi:hypothetical protein